MKKFLISFTTLTICALSANAQDTTTRTAQFYHNYDNQKMETSGELLAEKEKLTTAEKIKLRDANSSAEEKQKMSPEDHQKIMQKKTKKRN